jgi:hypothetical protein
VIIKSPKPAGIFRALAFVVGGLFIYAGAITVVDAIGFAHDIDNYKTLPWSFSVRLAFYLPWLEILCGLALITGWLYFGGLTILTGLISVFILASIAAKARGLDITCGCFGHAGKNLSFTWHLVIDVGILAVLVVLCFWDRRNLIVQPGKSAPDPRIASGRVARAVLETRRDQEN